MKNSIEINQIQTNRIQTNCIQTNLIETNQINANHLFVVANGFKILYEDKSLKNRIASIKPKNLR